MRASVAGLNQTESLKEDLNDGGRISHRRSLSLIDASKLIDSVLLKGKRACQAAISHRYRIVTTATFLAPWLQIPDATGSRLTTPIVPACGGDAV